MCLLRVCRLVGPYHAPLRKISLLLSYLIGTHACTYPSAWQIYKAALWKPCPCLSLLRVCLSLLLSLPQAFAGLLLARMSWIGPFPLLCQWLIHDVVLFFFGPQQAVQDT